MSTQPHPLLLVVSNNNASDHPSEDDISNPHERNSNFNNAGSDTLWGPFGCVPSALSALPSGKSLWDPISRLRLVRGQLQVPVLHRAALGLHPAALVPWGRVCGPPRCQRGHPPIPADVAAAATEANRVTLLATQSIPKFRSEAERGLYKEARTTRAALELGLAQIRSSLRRLRMEQESIPALLGELVAAVGKLPTAAAHAVATTRGDGRKEGEEDREVGAAYGA
ncbi:hypothetical protein GMDG_04800 [Pseudogymnoascus destructans 20631-21]|uniref:Uncharacterized protein n=1 Tax=Pseudogymnoascus destructans (strain ATCC MYA-4855 / 20631-21) TaxID=658429 RepID=L8GBD7_PSED2|nr:hypothetical protein GMDG_04800 [Pseudogymnoascus destructans 20631-21]